MRAGAQGKPDAQILSFSFGVMPRMETADCRFLFLLPLRRGPGEAMIQKNGIARKGGKEIMMKRTMTALLLAAVLATPAAAGAENAYTLRVNGGEAIAVEGGLMLPLRTAAEALGYTVTWDNGTTVLEKNGVKASVTIGETAVSVTRTGADGKTEEETVALHAAPYMAGGVTYAPAELFVPLVGEGESLRAEGWTQVGRSGETAPAEAPAPEAAAPEAEVPAPETEAPAAETAAANPFTDYASLEEAEAGAGFDAALPDEPYDDIVYRAIPGDMMEIIYRENGEEALRLRKGKGSGDISGDYSAYKTVKTIRVDGVNVRMRGSGNRMSLATWSRDGYAYSAHAAEPRTIADMMTLVRNFI